MPPVCLQMPSRSLPDAPRCLPDSPKASNFIDFPRISSNFFEFAGMTASPAITDAKQQLLMPQKPLVAPEQPIGDA